MMSNNKLNEIRCLAAIAVKSNKRILNAGNYGTVPNDVFRKFLPELRTKYDGITARDCIVLWLFLCSYVNRDPNNSFFMWAYPTVAQISSDTGIHRDRIKKLCDILISEEMLITRKLPYKGHTKKIFLPIYRDGADVEMVSDERDDDQI